MTELVERNKIEELLAGAKQNRDQHLYNFHAAAGAVQVLELLLVPPPVVDKPKRKKPNAKVKVARVRRARVPAGANGVGEGTERPAVG